jgi:hypothetical protein
MGPEKVPGCVVGAAPGARVAAEAAVVDSRAKGKTAATKPVMIRRLRFLCMDPPVDFRRALAGLCPIVRVTVTDPS